MKRLTLALSLLFPVFLMASGRKGSSPKKFKLPHGTTIEVGERLVNLVDANRSPDSPVDAGNLGLLDTEQLPMNEDYFFGNQSESLELPPAPVETSDQTTQRPLSPADRSKNWRAETRLQSVNTCQFGDKIFVAAQPPSHADLASDWRSPDKPVPQEPAYGSSQFSRCFRTLRQRYTLPIQAHQEQAQRLAVAGTAMWMHNKNKHR